MNFLGKNYSTENRKAVMASPIIAKAVCRNDKGEILILAVFQKSTKLEFYWLFRAKSQRSSRRSWKYAGHAARDFAFRPPYFDFGSFVIYHALMHNLTVMSQRVMHKKRLSGLLVKTEHDSIMANWEPQNPRMIVTDRCRKIMQRARSRRLAW